MHGLRTSLLLAAGVALVAAALSLLLEPPARQRPGAAGDAAPAGPANGTPLARNAARTEVAVG